MTWYNTALQALGAGQLDLTTGAYKVALTSSAYTPAVAHAFLSSVTNILATATLTTVTWSSAELIIADASIPDPGTGTAAVVVLYKDTGVAGTSRLVGFQTGVNLVFDGTADTLDFPATFTLRLLAV